MLECGWPLDATLLHRTVARGPWEARPMTTSQQCDDHRSNWVDEHGMAHCLMCNVTFPDPDAMAALRGERDTLAAELAQARAELADHNADSDSRAAKYWRRMQKLRTELDDIRGRP